MGQDIEKWRGIFPYNPLQLESASPAHYFWSQISCGVLPWFQSSCSFCTHVAWCIRSMSSTWCVREWKISKCTLYHVRAGNNYGGRTDLGKPAWTFAPNRNAEFWRFAKIWLIFLPLCLLMVFMVSLHFLVSAGSKSRRLKYHWRGYSQCFQLARTMEWKISHNKVCSRRIFAQFLSWRDSDQQPNC